MTIYGAKITLPTKSVDSVEPRDYVLNSEYGTVKTFKEPPSKTYQTINVNNGSYADVTVAHGLPFVPLVMFFTELKPGSGHWYMGMTNSGGDFADPTDASGAVTIDPDYSYVDSTNIKIRYANATGSNLTIKYYYFIFADNG